MLSTLSERRFSGFDAARLTGADTGGAADIFIIFGGAGAGARGCTEWLRARAAALWEADLAVDWP